MSQYIDLLTVALGALSAVLTGVVTHVKAPSQVKALVLLGFSLAAGAIVQAAQSTANFTWHGFLTAASVAFTAGVVAHKGDLINFITGPNGLVTRWVPGGLAAPAKPAAPEVVADLNTNVAVVPTAEATVDTTADPASGPTG